MLWPDRLEKIGRFILWLTLSSMFVMVPLAVIGQHRTEAERAEDARKAEIAAAAAEKARKPLRLNIASMGGNLSVVSVSGAEGHVWFTNVSSRSGIVCATGSAINLASQEHVDSLPTCKGVDAYASVQMTFMFPGSTLSETCKAGGCRLRVHDVPDAAP